MSEQTLLIIKPDAMPKASQVLAKVLLDTGLELVQARKVYLYAERVDGLYGHVKEVMGERYKEMATFLSSTFVLAVCLEGEDAVARLRAVLGPTNAKKAPEGTIRHMYGDRSEDAPMYRNAAHASDAPERALYEIKLILN